MSNFVKTLTTEQAAELLCRDRGANWSKEGALALCYFLEEANDGQWIEFDSVALRCDFNEYATATEAATDYGYEAAEENAELIEKKALKFLQQKTTVIEFEGGIIVQAW